jgi:hypothetical protein
MVFISLNRNAIMSDELGRMWKEAVMAYFYISLYLPGGTNDNHEKSVSVTHLPAEKA